ncbi:MAG TPA: cation:proton antiporter [Terriglobales bacterium]
MDLSRIFGLPAALLVVAVIANRLSRWTRVPDIIVLLLIGVGIGPILHWVDPSHFSVVRVLGMLALILILFEGGLELRLKETIRYSPGAILLAVVSYGLTVGLIACIARVMLHLTWMDCALLGAVLGSTSASVVLPAIAQIDAPEAIKITLTLEASLGEIVAVLTVGTLMGLDGRQPIFEGLISGFGHHVLVDVVLGIAAGVAWSRVWPQFASQQFSNALNLGMVLGVFAVGRYAGGSGLLAELVFGLTLANMPRTPHTTRQGARMMAFHSELTFLVRSFFFVLLGIMAQFVSRSYVVPILGILVALVLARYVAVQATRWSIRDIVPADSELLFLMMPRGLITAVLALQVLAARGQTFFFLPAMAFTVVLFTNVFVVVAAVTAKKIQTGIAPAGIEAVAVSSVQSADPETLA